MKLSPSARVGMVMGAAFVLVGVLGPLVAPYEVGFNAVDLGHRFEPPSAAHWLGTDPSGKDTLSQLLNGARSALQLSLIVVTISALIGVTIGTISGWFRGAVDDVIMRLVDVLMAFPGILMNIAIVAVWADPGIGVMIAALCANGWVGYARVARGEVLGLRERDYVTAAVALGASNRRVMFRHLMPNLVGPLLVQMTLGFGTIIIVEASLTFLGLGPQVDYTWGAMLARAGDYLWHRDRSWVALYALVPGLAIMWVVLGANLLGDGLRDRFDPRQRGRS
ncbi:MAG: ABC transporter permease [Kofleriaceae bacterium]